MLAIHISIPPITNDANKPKRDQMGLTFFTGFKSEPTFPSFISESYSFNSVFWKPSFIALQAICAAEIPEIIALWFPFILGTFTRPAEQPSINPPGKESFGIDWYPPSVIALAP